MKKIRANVAPSLIEILRARLRLSLLDRSESVVELRTPQEVKTFTEAAAYWSQPTSVGDEGWTREHQTLVSGVLVEVLRHYLPPQRAQPTTKSVVAFVRKEQT